MIFKAQTEWVKPTEFPDLRHCDEIVIDLETYDPELKTHGSGAIIGKGKVSKRKSNSLSIKFNIFFELNFELRKIFLDLEYSKLVCK